MHGIDLKLANNSVFVFKLLFRLLSSVEIKSLQPLWESLKLRLAFQFIGVDLQNIVKKAKSFFLTFSRATLDLTLFLCTFGLNFVPHTLPEPVAIDFNATSKRIYETDLLWTNGSKFEWSTHSETSSSSSPSWSPLESWHRPSSRYTRCRLGSPSPPKRSLVIPDKNIPCPFSSSPKRFQHL